MPAITMVSRWVDSEHDLFVRNAAQIKAIWLRYGAEDFRISRVHTGPNVGQYEVAIRFGGWTAFGEINDRVSQDEALAELMVASVRLKSNHFWDMNDARRHEAFPLPVARLSFDYGGEIVPSTCPVQTLERVDDDRLILTPRDMRVEQKAGARLARLGVKALNSLPFDVPPEHAGDLIIAPAGDVDPYRVITSFNDPARFIAFSTDCVPLLVKDGWQVAFSDDYPYRIAEGDPQWWADIGFT